MIRDKYNGWTNFELAEAMVDNIAQFEDREPQDLANTWDRWDMIHKLLNSKKGKNKDGKKTRE